MDQKVEALSREIDSLSELRDTLLPKLLLGEIELGDTANMKTEKAMESTE
jgi:type I restriction enzyme S subunit